MGGGGREGYKGKGTWWRGKEHGGEGEDMRGG